MKKILSAFVRLLSKVIGRQNVENMLIYCAKSINVDLHIHGLIQNGGLSSFNQAINGEQVFVGKTLVNALKPQSKPVMFDVGANVGDFSLELTKVFPGAEIYAFEPVKPTFDLLVKNTMGYRIKVQNIGFSDSIGTGQLFNTLNKTNNTIASAYPEVFKEIFNNEGELATIEFNMETIDDFCQINAIPVIDFLKIDVEGHEISVLRGATKLLLNNSIKIIQFEFNAHNVYSRVFLRDFYLILKGFEFYRIVPDGLIALGPYHQLNEIFSLQNIVAVRTDLCHLFKAVSLNRY